ncbi:MAG: hypothetical protein RL219_113 [Actinomycetota bacterium]
MRVFLDIGGHTGETLRIALDPKWAFDRIHVFEPASHCWPLLDELADHRTVVHRFGLWDSDARLELHNPGAIGASVMADKDPVTSSEWCEFRDAATWFAEHLSPDDDVIAKVNVEGAEVEVIARLAAMDQLRRIRSLFIHFDAAKSPSRAHLVTDTKRLLDQNGVRYFDASSMGPVRRATANWLAWSTSSSPLRTVKLRFRTLEALARRQLYPLKQRLRR